MISPRKSPLLATALSAVVLTYGSAAGAATISDDFSYASAPLMGLGAGSGWSAPWGASTGTGAVTGRVLIDPANNLTYSLGGYNVVQSGTGLAYGNFNDFRGINRPIDIDLTGTVWFSLLINNAIAENHVGLQFNNHADGAFAGIDYGVGAFHVEVFGANVQARYGGTQSGNLATLSLGATHLLLGRLTIGAGNDRLELWVDPADVLNPGTPVFNDNSADLGSNLYLAGIFSYGSTGTGGKADALRMSDGNGDATQALKDVTGVPEPSSALLMLAGGLAIGSLHRRTRSRV